MNITLICLRPENADLDIRYFDQIDDAASELADKFQCNSKAKSPGMQWSVTILIDGLDHRRCDKEAKKTINYITDMARFDYKHLMAREKLKRKYINSAVPAVETGTSQAI